MFKGKILSTYFPNRYLNVFSDYHLEHFLVQFHIDTYDLIWSAAPIKRQALLDFKNNDSIMKSWTPDIFSYFLYNVYPFAPGKGKPNDLLNDFKPPVFHVDPKPEVIEMDILPSQNETDSTGQSQKGGSNSDYLNEARKNKVLGDRAEQIVLEMEKQRLKKYPTLIKKIKKCNLDSDGFDIRSYEEGNSIIERQIEVKGTGARAGAANFYLTQNERDKANSLPNYYLYIVFEIFSERPKVWQIKNPFKPQNLNIRFKPVLYKVSINGK